MPTEKCPIEGFEEIEITFPDHWLVKHNEIFWKAYREAGEVSHNTALLYGSVAVCSEIKGVPDDCAEWPLEIFHWFIDTIYNQSLQTALNRSKKNDSLSNALIMPTS